MKVAHITLYPQKGEKHVRASGVASYSKNLVAHIAAHNDHTVVCDRVAGKKEIYSEDNVQVHRVFERNPGFILSVHSELKNINADVVHIQQELALFGGIVTAYLLQWLVFLWRKKTVITLHGVVDPQKIDARFVKENNSTLPVWMVKCAFRIIYTPLMKWAQKVIVHEQYFKDILVQSYGIAADKIVVIPHGVETFTTLDKQEAREKLQLPKKADIVLFMGYATGYKGINLLIDGFAAYAHEHPNAYLVIGAGKHPKLHRDAAYLTEYARLQKKAAQSIPKTQYRWEGFINEPDITTYYSASDVSLYPYTTAIASSGPMSFAIGHDKPFLVSTAFADIFSNYPQLLFDHNANSLAQKLDHFFTHQTKYEQASSDMKQERTWETVGRNTLDLYTSLHTKSEVR